MRLSSPLTASGPVRDSGTPILMGSWACAETTVKSHAPTTVNSVFVLMRHLLFGPLTFILSPSRGEGGGGYLYHHFQVSSWVTSGTRSTMALTSRFPWRSTRIT